MTDEQIALSRRAVACKGWRWMHGMSNTRGEVIDRVDVETGKAYYGEWDADMTALPDLTDAATLGCLLALVREAHGRCCYTQVCGGYWTIQNDDTEDAWGDHCATEAEALVAALEAAPKQGEHRREEKP